MLGLAEKQSSLSRRQIIREIERANLTFNRTRI
jgi:hypothetical protein